jgi:hypothetical protein
LSALAGAQRRLVDVEFVRIDGALHDGLAETISGRDEYHVAKARVGVEREHHAGAAKIAAHHMLHADGKRHGVVVEFVVHAIGDGAIVEQRGKYLMHALQQMRFAAHVQERLLLACKRRIRQILGRGGRAHRNGEVRDVGVAAHAAPSLEHLGLELGGERRGQHPAPDLRAHYGQAVYIIDIE